MFMTSGFALSTLMSTASDFGVDRVDLSPLPFDSSFSFHNRVAAASLFSLAACTLAAASKLLCPSDEEADAATIVGLSTAT